MQAKIDGRHIGEKLFHHLHQFIASLCFFVHTVIYGKILQCEINTGSILEIEFLRRTMARYHNTGFLQYKALSGYDLKAEFDFSLQWSWPADQSHIYRTLARLAEKKLIETEVIRQHTRPDRKVYHITRKGREELQRWLSVPALNKDVRLAQLIQIFFSGHLMDEQVIKLFGEFAEIVRRTLAELHEIPRKIVLHKRNIQTSPRDEFLRLITLEYLTRTNEAYLALLEDVIARLKRGEHLLECGSEDARSGEDPGQRTKQIRFTGKNNRVGRKKDRG
jgi:PadR family transcriptional regulator, regulatory protein AphA